MRLSHFPLAIAALLPYIRTVTFKSIPMEPSSTLKTEIFPVLPLRDIVVFPSMVVPLFVGREKSVRALEEVVRREGKILLVTQKNGGVDDPKHEDLHLMGTLGTILQLLRL